MAFETGAVRGVPTFYGPRTSTEGLVGVLKVEGNINQFSLEFTGQNILDDVWNIQTFIIPAGSKILRAITEISEAFVLGGTTPTIDVGTDGSEGTNGFDIAEADAELIGVYEDTTFAGTWALRLAADTLVSVALGGGTPTVTAAGRAKIIIEYALI